MGVSQNWGCLVGSPHKKDYSILGSTLGSLILGNYHMGIVIKFVSLSWLRYPSLRLAEKCLAFCFYYRQSFIAVRVILLVMTSARVTIMMVTTKTVLVGIRIVKTKRIMTSLLRLPCCVATTPMPQTLNPMSQISSYILPLHKFPLIWKNGFAGKL